MIAWLFILKNEFKFKKKNKINLKLGFHDKKNLNKNDDYLNEEDYDLLKRERLISDLFFVENFGLKKVEKILKDFTESKIFTKKNTKKKNTSTALYFNHVFAKNYNFFLKKIKKKFFLNKTIMFDLKNKQLYSFFFENNILKKATTNGILLKKLSIQKKNLKKSISTYTMHIKYFFKNVPEINYLISIKGMKFELYKIIKLIQKYHKNDKSNILIIPKQSLFKNQFKKIKAIKRKSKKKYVDMLRVKK